MADKYFIGTGGSVNWTNTATWSDTADGLTTPAVVPGAGDNVYPSAICPASSILVVDTAAQNCLDMDWTGAANPPTLTLSQHLQVFGNIVFIAGMTVNGTQQLRTQGVGKTLTSNGVVLGMGTLSVFGGSLSLADALNIGTKVLNVYGTFASSGFAVTCGNFTDSAGNGAITLGASVITCAAFSFTGAGGGALDFGSAVINCTSFAVGSAFTVTPGTSVIKVTGTGAFAGGGLTYNEVQLNGTAHTISGSNAFATLTLPSGTTQTITFTDGTTQTITTATLSGSEGHVHTLKGSGVAGWNLLKAGGGIVSADYLALSYSNASPALTWWAGTHSTDVVGNSGWTFKDWVDSAASPLGCQK